jgi:hypothetical protein
VVHPVDEPPADELDATIALAVRAAAAELAGRPAGPLDAADLRGALARAFERRTGRLTVVIEGDTTRLRGWPEPIGAVDLGVRGRMAGRQRAVASCAWWGTAGERLRTVRDACLLAAASRGTGLAAYLVVGAGAADWEGEDPAARLLGEGERATVPLLRDAGVRTLAGGPGTALVPARLRSTPIAGAPLGLGGEPWEVRAARVDAAGGDVTLPSE